MSLPKVDCSTNEFAPYLKPRGESDAANSPQSSHLADYKWQKYLCNFPCSTKGLWVLMEEFEESSVIDWDDLLNQKSDCANEDANDASFMASLLARKLNF